MQYYTFHWTKLQANRPQCSSPRSPCRSATIRILVGPPSSVKVIVPVIPLRLNSTMASCSPEGEEKREGEKGVDRQLG